MEAERQYGELTLESATAAVGAAEAAAAQPEISAGSYEVPCIYTDKPVYEAVKRGFDIIFAIVGLVLASPIMLFIAIAIKAEDGGPVIHKRKCVGLHGKPYDMYKFRSMMVGADDIDATLSPEQRRQYMTNVKVTDDPRITRTGRVIRRLSADELPQLLNILMADMSLIGPRCMVDFENALFGEYAEEVLRVRPGLTGYWQVYGRGVSDYENGERQKLELYYVKNRSFGLDAKLFFLTFYCVLSGKGAQ